MIKVLHTFIYIYMYRNRLTHNIIIEYNRNDTQSADRFVYISLEARLMLASNTPEARRDVVSVSNNVYG
jgi:hypothetical protein